MKTKSVLVLMALLTGTAGMVFAAVTEKPETWNGGQTEGWQRYDTLNVCNQPLNNPTDCLEVVFTEQFQPSPEVNIVRADINASEGTFAGNYWKTAVTNVQFKLQAGTHQPASIFLCFQAVASGNWWYRPLPAPTVGEWTDYNVNVRYEDGWWTGSGNSGKDFVTDSRDVAWVGIRLQRNDDLASHVFRVDDFVLRGASKGKDSDNDGADDWKEFIAGTDRGNDNSKFRLTIVHRKKNSELPRPDSMLQWDSAPGRTYAVRRSGNLLGGSFVDIATNIPATPPVNEYDDLTATNSGPYYYKAVVEE